MDEMLAAFADSVRRRPDDLALFDPDRRFSFKQLSYAVDALAQDLQTNGATAGDVVAWLGTVGLDCTIYALATQKAGLTLLAPNLGNTDAAIQQLLQDANTKCVVVEHACADRARAVGVQNPILVRADPNVTACDFAQTNTAPDALSNLTHTSGSTGGLKLISQNRTSQAFFDQAAVDLAGFQTGDIQCVVGHLWPAIVFSAIRAQVPIACFDAATFGPRALAEWMLQENITTLMTYPALFRQIAATGIHHPALRFVMLSGEPVSRVDTQAFNQITSPGARLLNSFGAMEFPCIATHQYLHGAPINFETMPLGKPIVADLITLINETNETCINGEVGEMQICSHNLASGYMNNAADDPDKFQTLPDGRKLYKTGDLAYRDDTGTLHSMGRADQQVKIRGYNVRLNEVESTIMQCVGVLQAAAIATETPNGNRRIECHYTGNASPDDLAQSMRQALPNYMMPSRFLLHPSLPLTPSGKIRRNVLANMAAQTGSKRQPNWQDETQIKLRDLMIPLLGHDEFGPADDFFDLGGDSLQAMSLLLSIERAFHRRLPFESFILEGASAQALSQKLVARTPQSRLTHLRQGQTGRTYVVVPNIGGDFSSYVEMMHAWGDSSDFVGVHPKGMHANNPIDDTIQAIAKDAVDVLLCAKIQPHALIGYSSAGAIAFEMALSLQHSGQAVPPIILLDPVAPWQEPSRLWRKLRNAPAKVLQAMKSGRADFIARLHPDAKRSEFVETHLNALAAYRPSPAPKTKAFLMTVEESQADVRSAAWADILNADTVTYVSAGNHSSAMRGSNAVLMTHQVQAWLAECHASSFEDNLIG